MAKDRTASSRASGTVITFRGFLAAYEEGEDARPGNGLRRGRGQEPDEAAPRTWTVGQSLDTRDVTADGHYTTPPPRYTEASWCEPSRSADRPPLDLRPDVATIMDRGYVNKRGNALVPSWTAFA